MNKINLIILEFCGIGAQLINIYKGISNNTNNSIIVGGIEYPYDNQNFTIHSIINDYFTFNCQFIKEPIDEFTSKLFSDFKFRKQVLLGNIKDSKYNIFTLKSLYTKKEIPVGNNRMLGTFVNVNNKEVVKKLSSFVSTSLQENTKYKNKIGIHLRLVNNYLLNPTMLVPMLLNTRHLSDRYIVIDNWKLFKKYFKQFIKPDDEIEYNEDIDAYIDSDPKGCNIFNQQKIYQNQHHSIKIANNLASCKKFFPSYNSAYSNILIPLIRNKYNKD